MAGAAADSAVDAVLAKNTQVAQLDADLARIAEELRALVPPGICALTAPSKMHGYVREMNAMPIIQALQQGNDRAQRIAALVIEADRELRFLTDQELRAIQAELAAGDSAEGALLRAAAARMMRDFQGTIVEGAKEAVAEEAPGALSPPGPLADARVAQAYWDELSHLLRLSHYAAAAAVASFAVPQQSAMLRTALEKQGISEHVLRLSLVSIQKRSNFLCKCSQEAPKCWVASHYALLHLIESLA
eukprot:Tamp_23661.p1 GENE.Tamp_23661~~Tamp_23661.p1  ORF type:complete len:276 (+),score=89.95 Tamp_23661:91-828(+)